VVSSLCSSTTGYCCCNPIRDAEFDEPKPAFP